MHLAGLVGCCRIPAASPQQPFLHAWYPMVHSSRTIHDIGGGPAVCASSKIADWQRSYSPCDDIATAISSSYRIDRCLLSNFVPQS